VLTAGLSIAHSPIPISFNFWSNWSGGAFNYKNYLSDGRTQSLHQTERLVGSDANVIIEVTNGAFTPDLGKRTSMIRLFPSPNWMNANYIVIDKTKFKGAGSNSAQSAYASHMASALGELPRAGFTVLMEDDYVQLWGHIKQNGRHQ
jgi:hypothetical protein